MAASGELGVAVTGRVRVLTALHEAMQTQIAQGASTLTVIQAFSSLRRFYRWCDDSGRDPSTQTIANDFLDWTASLRAEALNGVIEDDTAVAIGHIVGALLLRADVTDHSLMSRSVLAFGRPRKRGLGNGTKQNLQETSDFCEFLLAVMNGMTREAIFGPLPIRIPLPRGTELVEWCRLIPLENVTTLKNVKRRRDYARLLATRATAAERADLASRYPAVNLRVDAEFLMFIAQTGLNPSTAAKLRSDKITLQSFSGGYRGKAYKGRRGGEVQFEICARYRPLFDRYRSFLKSVFPDEYLLFPSWSVIRRLEGRPTKFSKVRKHCAALGLKVVSPRHLRTTRSNWLSRWANVDTAVKSQQHAYSTFFSNYFRPDYQRAAVEVTKFFRETEELVPAVGPGACAASGKPLATESKPPSIAEPDCRTPSSCLFCRQHRDLPDLDYAWSLASYRKLKELEMDAYPGELSVRSQPAEVIVIATGKIEALLKIIGPISEGMHEALSRVQEASYHPAWESLIEALEGCDG